MKTPSILLLAALCAAGCNDGLKQELRDLKRDHSELESQYRKCQECNSRFFGILWSNKLADTLTIGAYYADDKFTGGPFSPKSTIQSALDAVQPSTISTAEYSIEMVTTNATGLRSFFILDKSSNSIAIAREITP